MRPVYAKLELTNGEDLTALYRGEMDEKNLRRVSVSALVDNSVVNLFINEKIKDQLDLQVVGRRLATALNGERMELEVARFLEIRFENRRTWMEALVLPGASKAVLGLAPLSLLDVLIDPANSRLIVHPAHPDMAVARI